MSAAQPSSADQQVIAAEHALFGALKNQDPKALSALLADDFQFRNAGDEPVGKADFLKAATTVDGTILSITSNQHARATSRQYRRPHRHTKSRRSIQRW